MEVCVAQHPLEDEVQFQEFIAQGMGHVDFPRRLDGGGQAGSEDALVEADQEQAGVASIGGEFVAGGAGLTTDEALAAESTQVIGHLSGAIVRRIAAEQGRHVLS